MRGAEERQERCKNPHQNQKQQRQNFQNNSRHQQPRQQYPKHQNQSQQKQGPRVPETKLNSHSGMWRIQIQYT